MRLTAALLKHLAMGDVPRVTDVAIGAERRNRAPLLADKALDRSALLALLAGIGLGVLGYALAQRREKELAAGMAVTEDEAEDDPEWDDDARTTLPHWLPYACYAVAAVLVLTSSASWCAHRRKACQPATRAPHASSAAAIWALVRSVKHARKMARRWGTWLGEMNQRTTACSRPRSTRA